jgi:hypothetical protein
MIKNTGNLSLALYLGFVFIAIAGMIFIYFLIYRNKLDNEKIDKIIELFKTVIITTAIGTVTLIIADLFKEREQDLNEMSAYKEYLPYVTDTVSSLDDKVSFCDFMVSVAPDGPLKKGWEHWFVKLKTKKTELAEINSKIEKEQNKIDTQATQPSDEQLGYIEQLEAEKKTILTDVNAKTSYQYLVVLGADKTIAEAQAELNFAKSVHPDATIYKKGTWYRTVIPINGNFDEAKLITQEVQAKSSQKKQAYVVSLKSWCRSASFSKTEQCIVCN